MWSRSAKSGFCASANPRFSPHFTPHYLSLNMNRPTIKLPAFPASNKILGVHPNRLENLDVLAPKHTMENSAGIGPTDSTSPITQLIVFYSRLLASLIPNDRIEGCRIRCTNCSKNCIWRGVSTAALSTSRIRRITSPPAGNGRWPRILRPKRPKPPRPNRGRRFTPAIGLRQPLFLHMPGDQLGHLKQGVS